jgi:hypothetical protein
LGAVTYSSVASLRHLKPHPWPTLTAPSGSSAAQRRHLSLSLVGWTEPDQTSPTQPRRPSLSPALSASTMPQPAFLSSLRSPAPASPQPSLQPSRGYHVELGAREKAVSPPPLNPILFPSPRFGTPISRSCYGLGLLVADSGLGR